MFPLTDRAIHCGIPFFVEPQPNRRCLGLAQELPVALIKLGALHFLPRDVRTEQLFANERMFLFLPPLNWFPIIKPLKVIRFWQGSRKQPRFGAHLFR